MDKKIPRPNEEIEAPKIKLKIKKIVVPLEKLAKMESKDEYNYIKELLVEIYENKLNIDRKMVLKCISLTCSKEDIKNFLPYGLIVEKKKDDLIFRTENKKSIILIILFMNILAFAMISATYSAIDFLSKEDLNKDINGDKIADINLDLDEDSIPEINIDTDDDDKPNINIDYKGNKKSVFNIDTNDDNLPDKNLITVVTDGICKKNQVNCDINNDGWPEANIDINGDGIADFDIDTDEDGIIDLNIDSDGNSICDINCDTNKDWKCDEYCISIEVITKYTNSLSTTGNPGVGVETANTALKVIFTDSTEIIAKNIYPDDQPGISTPIPDKVFTVENTTGLIQYYNLGWIVASNTFDLDNFMYEVESTNDGGTLEYTTYPKTNHIFLSDIKIEPYVTQSYVIHSKLRGMNKPQNEDQGKEFIGKIEVTLSSQG